MCFLTDLVALQQYLPFTVLKLTISRNNSIESDTLQQYLPFTVLKPLHVFNAEYEKFS